MSKNEKHKFGELSPLYNFILNPYPDQRISSCPLCRRRTGQRKIPLLIHVDPRYPIALNCTCKYCIQCDLLVAHKHEIEHLLVRLFSQHSPEVIGNEYLIIGTVEKRAWREGLQQPKAITEIRSQIHDFKLVYSEMRISRPGWYAPDQKPPVLDPPQSSEWVRY